MSSSELRKDIVSGEWVVLAPGRAKRPDAFIKKIKRERVSKKDCPFEDPQTTNHGDPLLVYPKDALHSTSRLNKRDKWRIQIIRNKYPAFRHERKCIPAISRGPYEVMEGIGYHHLLLTRDHHRNYPRLSSSEAALVFLSFQEHYKDLARDKCVKYVSFFHNWGPKAGASVYHPHYQIMALPMIPPDVGRSLKGSQQYYNKHKKCVHCTILGWERKEKKRIIYETKNVIAFIPYISREPFEARIFPKKHSSYFEDASSKIVEEVSHALRLVLQRMERRLKDPDYNFFIHSAPTHRRDKFAHYHWHIEVLPKMSVYAGFELGTGIEVTVVDPDDAARLLKIKK
ncbi:galactose-1-phosphate uridylyltransferase [bacterium]|nr:galactose-1-phosphate uridylyltransferase [bacterium]|tara:strand:+ start:913 stop:1938 length:1026 start_codon:yes stop_codon:yes gene_type:complete